VHTIAWVVSDNLGTAAGIGSRFFTVSNSGDGAAGSAPAPAGRAAAAPATSPLAAAVAGRRAPSSFVDALPRPVMPVSVLRGVPIDAGAIAVTRGYDPDAPAEAIAADGDGVYHVDVAPLERIAIVLDRGAGGKSLYSGYTIQGDTLATLPAGSHLDAAEGRFAWAPAPAFGGARDLVFVRTTDAGTSQIRVRVTVRPR
jgi:hypothetical protein